MYHPMSPMDNSYLEPQSEMKFKKRLEMPIQHYHKSPTREIENRAILSNRPITPVKRYVTNGSPFKTDQSIASINGNGTSKIREPISYSIKKAKRQDNFCHNHPQKTARYVIQTEDEQIPYCQKCSILLASQGFKVVRLEQNLVLTSKVEHSINGNLNREIIQLEDHQRSSQLNHFLLNLQGICSHLRNKKTQINCTISRVTQCSKGQIQQIDTYFQQLVQVIEQYKFNLITDVTKHQDNQVEPLRLCSEEVEDCLEDAQLMKEDILSSLEIIQQVQEKMFRKVMESYKSRQQSFKDQLYKQTTTTLAPLNLVFLTDSHRMEGILHELGDVRTQVRANTYRPQPEAKSFCKSMSSENQNPVIQESSEQENLLKNNISNNESYFKQFQ